MNLHARFAALFASLLVAGAAVAQQDYPNKPVRLVLGLQAGGSYDAVHRIIADKLRDRWKQPVVIDNRPGAAMMIAGEHVARSAPDGYTLLAGGSSFPLAKYAMKLNFEPMKDLVMVARTSIVPYVFVASTQVPARNMAELIAHAKANPGKLSFGVVVVGAGDHLAGLLLEKMTGTKFNFIVYKGAAAAMPELLNGQLDVRVDAYGSWKPHHEAGKARIIAASTLKRLSFAPDVPAASETVPGYENVGSTGIMVASATPRPIVDRISRDLAEVLKDSEVRQRFLSLGWEPEYADGPTYTAILAKEEQLFVPMLIELGIKPQ
jgi:tripartite-type tricarboxylate transporter receptor subunit TctC